MTMTSLGTVPATFLKQLQRPIQLPDVANGLSLQLGKATAT
jgi:hypothetical protein